MRGGKHRVGGRTGGGVLLTLLAAVMAVLAATGCRAQQELTPEQKLRAELADLVVRGRTPCELKPHAISTQTVGKTRVERVRITPDPGHDAVVLVVRPLEDPAGGRFPTVVFQHFLGGSKDHFLLQSLYAGLAARGYLVAAIDGRYRGERANGSSLDAAIARALKDGKERPFLADTTYDVLRLLDYLQTRPDVDAARIGMGGLSEGGIITWMAAAIDERIRVAIPLIGVTSFGQALNGGNDQRPVELVKPLEAGLKDFAMEIGEPAVNVRVLRDAWKRLLPGMLDRLDAPNVVPLIAPRPLLIICHEQDELFPIEGARTVHAAAESRYKSLNAADRLSLMVTPNAKHAAFSIAEVNAAMDWLDRWMKR